MPDVKFKIKETKAPTDLSLELNIDTENEQYVLACALKYSRCSINLTENTNYRDFLITNHIAIAWCIKTAIERQLDVTPEILHILINEYDGNKTATGIKYLYELLNSQETEPSAENFKNHVDKLKKDKIKHTIYNNHINVLIRDLKNPHSDITTIVSKVDNIRNYIENTDSTSDKTFYSLNEMKSEHDDEIANRETGGQFQSIGYRSLNDYLTEGLATKQISIVAGRPGMCKSAFVDNVILRLAKTNVPCALFSLEMRRIATYDRFLSIETEIPLKTLLRDRPTMTDKQKQLEKNVKFKMSKYPIYIYDKASPTLETIARHLKNAKERLGIKVAVFDLFSKIQKPDHLKHKSTADQISYMLDYMQQLAKNLDIHICLVVQIGRKAEARKGKRPQLSDLKDSGAYEEVADLVLLLYRESYYLTSENDRAVYFNNTSGRDILECTIAKQRSGEANGVVSLEFKPTLTKVVSL